MMKTPEPYRSAILDELLAQITPKEQEKVAIKMRVAVRLADRLEELGLQKKELAMACDLKGSSMVSKWLSGGHNFTLDTLVDIASALGMSVADMVRPVEHRVVFAQTVTVLLSGPMNPVRTTVTSRGELVSRASATGSSNVVSEPFFHYGKRQNCYA